MGSTRNYEYRSRFASQLKPLRSCNHIVFWPQPITSIPHHTVYEIWYKKLINIYISLNVIKIFNVKLLIDLLYTSRCAKACISKIWLSFEPNLSWSSVKYVSYNILILELKELVARTFIECVDQLGWYLCILLRSFATYIWLLGIFFCLHFWTQHDLGVILVESVCIWYASFTTNCLEPHDSSYWSKDSI